MFATQSPACQPPALLSISLILVLDFTATNPKISSRQPTQDLLKKVRTHCLSWFLSPRTALFAPAFSQDASSSHYLIPRHIPVPQCCMDIKDAKTISSISLFSVNTSAALVNKKRQTLSKSCFILSSLVWVHAHWWKQSVPSGITEHGDTWNGKLCLTVEPQMRRSTVMLL